MWKGSDKLETKKEACSGVSGSYSYLGYTKSQQGSPAALICLLTTVHCSIPTLYIKAFRSSPKIRHHQHSALWRTGTVTSIAWSAWSSGNKRHEEICILSQGRKIVMVFYLCACYVSGTVRTLFSILTSLLPCAISQIRGQRKDGM